MNDEPRLVTGKGGDHWPLSSREFILEHLRQVEEDYISSMHRAFKQELDRLAGERGRKVPYHKPRYHSFEMAVQLLIREGLIVFSGKEEPSTAPQFKEWETPPKRRYFRLNRDISA
jgi:hypothetical protein